MLKCEVQSTHYDGCADMAIKSFCGLSIIDRNRVEAVVNLEEIRCTLWQDCEKAVLLFFSFFEIFEFSSHDFFYKF